jgi:3-isopropylmalate/(R)-2-methylmalate dehydratase small subunit
MEPLCTIRSRALHIDADNVDTDQIIPARFLKTTSRTGLGTHVFADRRATFRALEGRARTDAHILVAGYNFGCGSSREHAAWALADFGIRAVVAPSIADIFAGNAVKSGIVPVRVGDTMHAALRAPEHADAIVVVDVRACTVAIEDGPSAPFVLDPFARELLLHGMDELAWLLAHEEAIDAYERGDRCAR